MTSASPVIVGGDIAVIGVTESCLPGDCVMTGVCASYDLLSGLNVLIIMYARVAMLFYRVCFMCGIMCIPAKLNDNSNYTINNDNNNNNNTNNNNNNSRCFYCQNFLKLTGYTITSDVCEYLLA